MKLYVKWFGRLFALAAIINVFIELVSRKSLPSLGFYIWRSFPVFLLNTLIIALPFTVVFVTKRKAFTCITISLIWCFMGVVNGTLLIFRTTPFTAADFRLIKYAVSLATVYFTWMQIIFIGAGIVSAVIFIAAVWRKAPVSKEKVRYGLGAGLIAISGVVVLGLTSAAMNTGLVAVHFGNIGEAFKSYGFPYCFSNSMFNTGISKPEGYGTETMEEIRDEELVPENTYALSEDTKPNVIMIQLESFFDPSLWKNNPVNYDPIPFFHHLQQSYPGGYLSVPSVGAGTANTEFETITGMNLDFFGPGEYPYKTVLKKTPCESVAFDLKNLGYSAHAIHNNEATFYDRNRVFSQLGFDTFTPIEYMNNVERNPTGWCKDKILTGEIIRTLDSTAGPDFIYTISVQGHGKYPNFEYYCQQIGEMDQFIRSLVNTLRTRKEPIVLVMYGDHLPGFEWSEDEMKNRSLFQTEYVIWNNMNLPVEKKNVEAYQLAAHVLDMLNIHEGTMMRFHQKYFSNPETEEESYLRDMKTLEYDILYGSREVYGGESPYQSTNLKMGIDDIVVDHVVYNDSNVLVYGENFTPYSKICFDGKAVETTFVWPELIIAKGVPEKKMKDSALSVWQIGRDKVPLGESKTHHWTNRIRDLN
ncbi:LTA synthase family protein [Lacrimispora sp.]|uniref:LTA synthase family protein n=1 Tax=Lacrimispora sp. TaxID=2719234 RepID=UPI00285AD6E9|nr:LTA synthase family protein [Lacrimispora sp.]MDR7813810.1 LTA synthase family protein [Lacrimispora sp.]